MRDGAFTAGEPSEREGTASRTRASRRIGKFSFLPMTHERTKRSTGLPGPGAGPGPGRELLLRQGSRDPVRPFDEQRALGSHEVAEAGAVQVVLVRDPVQVRVVDQDAARVSGDDGEAR